MSPTLVVGLKASELPTRVRLQAELDSLSLDVQLHPELDLSTDEGFSPTVLGGRASGFELQRLDRGEVAEDYPRLMDRVQDLQRAVEFQWGGDLAECACVLATAAGLVSACDATAYYPDDDMLYEGQQLIDDYKTCLDSL